MDNHVNEEEPATNSSVAPDKKDSVSDMAILFEGNTPIKTSEFLERMNNKCGNWEDFNIPLRGNYDRLSPLEATWNMNCRALNYAINDNKKGVVKKYVVSAPTGSAKTESLITYCSMLPDGYTALIATNLTDEADNIARKINEEAISEAKDIHEKAGIKFDESQHIRAYSYHNKIPKEKKLTLQEVAKYQVVITTHAFYKTHYTGSNKWTELGVNRDLLVIDEALETMQEYSVKDNAITRAITIFSHIQKSNKFKGNEEFTKELEELKYELRLLESLEQGTNLVSTNSITDQGLDLTLFDSVDKYKVFLQILGLIQTEDKAVQQYIRTVKFNQVLAGNDDPSNDKKIKKELVNTISSLNLMAKIGQVYVTAHQGSKSFNRVTDMMFKKSLVCFDATAEVNNIYRLRAKYYDDIHLIKKHPNVRNYSNVTLHYTTNRTSKKAIDKDLVSTILTNIQFGDKTLIVTHDYNEPTFKAEVAKLFPDKVVDYAHWGAITGLNTWNDFDTCIIAGLNHKPVSFAQNRVLVSTGSEDIAFGEDQNSLNDSIESSILIAELIQAMNRIRIRKIIDDEGNCAPANLYVLFPKRHEAIFKQQIVAQMPNIQLSEWNGKLVKNTGDAPANFTILIDFLNARLKSGDKILKKELVKDAGIKPDSFRTMMGKKSQPAKKKAFMEMLRLAGYGIEEEIEKNKKLPKEYFYRIDQN